MRPNSSEKGCWSRWPESAAPASVLNIKRIYVLAVVIMICGSLRSQLFYHDHVILAKRALSNAHCDSALVHYQNAFSRYVGSAEDRAGYAKALKCAGQEERCLEEVMFAIDSLHMHEYRSVFIDPIFTNWKNPELFITFLIKADSIVDFHLKKFNTEYRDRLLEIELVDQHIRKVSYELELSEQVADTVMKKVWQAMGPIDSLHQQQFIRLLNAYGYPDIDIVGADANQAAWLIVQHSKLPTQDLFIPLLKSSCDRGQTPMKYYAYVHDRRINNAGSSYVKYGCSLRLEEDGVYWLRAENKACLNFYREQVGLPPMDEFREYGPCIKH